MKTLARHLLVILTIAMLLVGVPTAHAELVGGASPAHAEPIAWTPTYVILGDQSHFWGPGTYLLLTTHTAPDAWQVYLYQSSWVWQGTYGSLDLPDTLPELTLIRGYNIFLTPVVAPEPAPCPEPTLKRPRARVR